MYIWTLQKEQLENVMSEVWTLSVKNEFIIGNINKCIAWFGSIKMILKKTKSTEKTENTLSSNESSNRLDFVKIKSFTETWLKQIHTRPH